VVYPAIKEGNHLCNDYMKGPFKEQVLDTFADPAKCHGIKLDFTYMFGSFGCESML